MTASTLWATTRLPITAAGAIKQTTVCEQNANGCVAAFALLSAIVGMIERDQFDAAYRTVCDMADAVTNSAEYHAALLTLAGILDGLRNGF